MTQANLQCPKCLIELRSFERTGIVVEQCGNCKGIFLDRGELERLVDAESDYLASLPSDDSAATQSGYVGKRRSGFMSQFLD